MNRHHSSSLETKGNPQELNKAVPVLPVEEVSEELLSLLNDSSLSLFQQSELVTLRSFEREALDFEVPSCSECNEGNPFLFRVSGNSCYCLSCGYREE